MTDLLTTVMHERADALPGPGLDLDAILAEGERRVRRQRVGTGLVAAALVGAVSAAGLSVSLLLGGADQAAPTSQPGEFEQRHVTYAVGHDIFWAGQTLDVGRPVASFVATDNGFVFTGPDGGVWLYDGTAAARIGTAEDHRLRADDQGSLVAWVDTTDPRQARYVVYDTATRSRVARLAADVPGAKVFAVDDGSVYWRRGQTLVRYDVPFDRESVLAAEPGAEVLDVSYGTLAYTVGHGQTAGTAVGQTLDSGAPVVARARQVLLSPNARYLAAMEGDTAVVRDVRTGEDVTPDTSGYPYAAVTGWVDADTASVVAVTEMHDDGRASGDVLTCDIGGGCVATTSFRDVAGEALVPPVGDPMS